MIEIKTPGDKSISHRALIFSAIAEGMSHIKNFLVCEDTLSTLRALRELGVNIEREGMHVVVHGVGLQGLKKPKKSLNLGNSGTSMRLLTGLLAAQDFDSELIGDESLMRRPMARVVKPLRLMGAKIAMRNENFAPLKITGGQSLKGIVYEMSVASAQVKSAILIAGLYAKGETKVIETAVTRDHTERLLVELGKQYCRPVSYAGETLPIPGDLSTAAFFIVATLLLPNKELVLKGVGVNPTRMGVITIFKKMGAKIELINERETFEPIANIKVTSSQLHGVTISHDQISLAIDELPIVMIAAVKAKGKTIIRGAAELRVKESDRLHAMAEGLKALGVKVQEHPDGIDIEGGGFTQAAKIKTFNDHRIAMSFAVANLLSDQQIAIDNRHCVNISCPDFFELLSMIGAADQSKN